MTFRIPRSWCNADASHDVQEVRDAVLQLRQRYRRARTIYERYTARAPPALRSLERMARCSYNHATRSTPTQVHRGVFPLLMSTLLRRTPELGPYTQRAAGDLYCPSTNVEDALYTGLCDIMTYVGFIAASRLQPDVIHIYEAAIDFTFDSERIALLLAEQFGWLRLWKTPT